MTQKILLYLGANLGNSLSQIVHLYDKVYAFEANPNLIPILNQRFQHVPHIEIIQGALSNEHDTEVNFYLQLNEDQGDRQMFESSSLGELCDYYREKSKNKLTTHSVVKVKTINLATFLKERNITQIHTYASDLEGVDLDVLKTMKEFIDNKKIKFLHVETERDIYEVQSHIGLNSNSQREITSFLSENYKVFGKAKGESHWFEQDVFYQLKDSDEKSPVLEMWKNNIDLE